MIKESVEALEALRELTRSIYSTQLARFGLPSAISAHLRRTSSNGSFTIEESARGPRFGWPVESAAYFCYVMAVRELQPPVAVNLDVQRDNLRIVVAGGPAPAPDLRHLQDRLDPLAGSVTWVRAVGRSVLTITVPTDGDDVGAFALAAECGRG